MKRFVSTGISCVLMGCLAALAGAEPLSQEGTSEPASTVEMLPPVDKEATPEEGLSLEQLERIALANNPVVGQAAAKVRAMRGKYVQVGLPPNPTVGYMAGEVFEGGTAGQQGGFVGQEFVTADKLQRNRAVVAAEIERAEQNLIAVQTRIRTDLRLAFYQALVAQSRLEVANQLVEVASAAVKSSEDLLQAEEIPRAGLLQTEVELQNAYMQRQIFQNQLAAVWQQLNAVLGGAELPQQRLEGDPTVLPEELNWQNTLARIQTVSPEIAIAMAELSRARRALNRASVEAVPNIQTQVSVQHADSSDDVIAGFQVGIPLPLWNRNQGGISQAQAEVALASQNIDRVALNLQQRLAVAFQNYRNAYTQAATLSAEILPRAEQTLDLVRQGYSSGEVGYLDLLTAQRVYTQTNLTYLNALETLWQNWTRINGLLLDESLNTDVQ